ncbi:NUDIX hydrolase [Arsenicicoccus dermatophilus]|uniref:NUDIX hydrolase n=1 Tax=Arsenicicoccus dermatophilus TaxID=1076331 RepID=UPI003916D613
MRDLAAGPPDGTWLDALHADAVRLLTGLEPVDDREAQVRARMLAHLAEHPDAWSRQGPPEHFTASVLVVTEDWHQVLLTHHRKARTWLQLGGHADPGDDSVLAAARREGREESGLADLQVRPVLVDLDRHGLVGSFGRCREHLDLRCVAVVPPAAPTVSAESLDVAWWPVDALPRPHGQDLPRLLANARRRAG